MNRNKVLSLFVSNLANVIVHKVLERAIDKPEVVSVYMKEVKNSLEIAKKYREKINPLDRVLPAEQAENIREAIVAKARAELNSRIKRGYTNINLSLIEGFVDASIKELGITKPKSL